MVTKISKKPLNRSHTAARSELFLTGLGRVTGTQIEPRASQWLVVEKVPLGRCS